MNTNERIKEMVARMVLKNNYWGYLFSRIRRRPAESLPSIMGVAPESDATITLYYNPSLIDLTEDDVLEVVIEHEGGHILNKHIPRLIRLISNELNESKKGKKIAVWNIAADCCVNSQASLPPTITVAGLPIMLQFPKLHGLPDNQIAEFYYHKLLERRGKGSSKSGKNVERSEGSGGEKGNEESSDGKGSGQIDDHSKWLKNIEHVPDLSSLSRKMDNYVGNIIKESAKTFNRNRGDLPGYIQELIQEMLAPPKAPYYQIIKKLVRGSRFTKFKRSFTKVNRKRTYVFVIGDQNIPAISPFPGKTRDFSFKISILLDTSGSMTKEDILEGLSGIKNLIENDRHCLVTVLENDARVNKEYEVKRLRDIQFNITGRCGTVLRPGLERCRELKTDITLCFSDGCCEDINVIPRKFLPRKLVWVIGGEGSTVSNVYKTGYIVQI